MKQPLSSGTTCSIEDIDEDTYIIDFEYSISRWNHKPAQGDQAKNTSIQDVQRSNTRMKYPTSTRIYDIFPGAEAVPMQVEKFS